ncbi:uncharacterized protein K441DRAFT_676650 [Cenococcum geophilum 1.58]|uniref:uncharacterized protein n=1 Tax=Cenococcum geophilum 1.58 TaxID=794803 RepID=UPI00358F5AEF|nr:hypothetical protein K441DRAFT_676650 [Cenococcum geophilum 1.58]
MDMQKMQFEITAQQMIIDSISSMQKSQEAREQRRDQKLQSQIPAYQYQPGPYIQHPPLYAPPSIPPPQPSPQPPAQPPAYSQQPQQQLPRPIYTPSAPPTGFIRDPRRKLKWQRAKDITEEQDWKIKDLKQMENGSSRLYQLAIQLGISNRPFYPRNIKFTPLKGG